MSLTKHHTMLTDGTKQVQLHVFLTPAWLGRCTKHFKKCPHYRPWRGSRKWVEV